MKKPMRRIVIVFTVLVLLNLFGCGGNGTSNNGDTAKITGSGSTAERTPPTLKITDAKQLSGARSTVGETVLTVSERANPQKLNGFGAEWDSHTGMEYNTLWFGEETADEWEFISSRVRELGLQKVRMWILPGYYEPENDNDDPSVADMNGFKFDSTEFKSVLSELEVLQRNGVDVNITIWGADLTGTSCANAAWLAFPFCNDWISAPNDLDEYAENISVLLDYLIKQKKYTCIKELTLHNEPDWAWKSNGGWVDFDYYVQAVRTVDARLRQDGLRSKIKLIVSDDVNGNSWLDRCIANLDDVADGYNSHCYLFDADSSYDEIYNWALKLNEKVAVTGKPYTHNEYGSNNGLGANRQTDIDTYERGIFLSTSAEATLNAGSSGILYWVLFDQFYRSGPRNGALMHLGLFNFCDRNWRVRPIYHAWGLIMKYTVPGSDVFPVTGSGEVSGAALKSPGGKWTYIATNRGDTDRLVRIDNAGLTGDLNVYFYSRETADITDDRLIGSSGKAYTEGVSTYVYLDASSFAVLTQVG